MIGKQAFRSSVPFLHTLSQKIFDFIFAVTSEVRNAETWNYVTLFFLFRTSFCHI